MRHQNGLTLVELLITAAIIAVLAAIAVPAYQDHTTRAQLADAHATLGATRTRLEQYYQDNRSYPPQCGAAAGTLPAFIMPANTTYFSYACVAGATAGQTFFLSASGIAGRAVGFTFAVDENGGRSTTAVPTGWSAPSPNNCWVTKRGGVC
jgi:type IV pilus assembly protein PilE